MGDQSVIVREIDGILSAYGAYMVAGVVVYAVVSLIGLAVGMWIIRKWL